MERINRNMHLKIEAIRFEKKGELQKINRERFLCIFIFRLNKYN